MLLGFTTITDYRHLMYMVMFTRKPEYVIWIFTATCNLDCIHCYTYRFRKLRELSLNLKLKLAKDIGESSVEYVNLTGGEPLIHSHFPDMVLELHRYGVEKSVVTNATVVKDSVLEVLYKTETYVFATLEGPREVHEAIRGKGSYDATVRGIEKIKRVVGSLSVIATINKVNYKHVHEVVDLAVSLDSDELALLPIMPSGRALETQVYISAREFTEAFKKAYERAREYGLRISTWCTPFAPLLKRDVAFWFCRDMSGIDVDPEGNVLLCDILDFKITNVVEKGILNAFREFRDHELVKKVRSPPELPMVCKTCHISFACRGGCFARAYNIRKDLNAGDPLCPRVAGVDMKP